MRDLSDEHYEGLNEESIINRLQELHEYKADEGLTTDQLRNKLKHLGRNRHLMIWHDNSTVANHGYLVCLVSELYDPAVFLTNEEYKAKAGKTVDVQTAVEKPHEHFIARCNSSEAEQVAYSETRMSCVKEMARALPSANDNQIVDTLRFFHGDSPARQFESGQQKGGNYYCSSCGCHAARANELDYASNCKLVSLEDRQDAMMKPGTVARSNSLKQKSKPVGGLSKEQLGRELAARGVFSGRTKQELQHLLDMELHGIQRVPALLVNDPCKSLEELLLEKYEILPTEPLHDVAHHIENVFEQFPHHLEAQEGKAFQESITMCFGSKDSKRRVDYRAALVKTTAYLRQNHLLSEDKLQVLDTLTEMQRILYSSDEKRTPQLILCYYNQSWYHAILLKQLMSQPKKLTQRKLFGVYFHDLTTHGGLMLRLISGQAANAEEDERIFHRIKAITKKTSNYSNNQVIPNLFVRLQAERKIGRKEDAAKQQGYISKLSESLRPPQNTRVPISVIKKHSREWQAHLQEISDFLQEGEGVWWHLDNDTVEFHDISESPQAEKLALCFITSAQDHWRMKRLTYTSAGKVHWRKHHHPYTHHPRWPPKWPCGTAEYWFPCPTASWDGKPWLWNWVSSTSWRRACRVQGGSSWRSSLSNRWRRTYLRRRCWRNCQLLPCSRWDSWAGWGLSSRRVQRNHTPKERAWRCSRQGLSLPSGAEFQLRSHREQDNKQSRHGQSRQSRKIADKSGKGIGSCVGPKWRGSKVWQAISWAKKIKAQEQELGKQLQRCTCSPPNTGAGRERQMQTRASGLGRELSLGAQSGIAIIWRHESQSKCFSSPQESQILNSAAERMENLLFLNSVSKLVL